MQKNNTLWLLLLALSSLFAACKKDSPQDELSKLPTATQTGANTFGCLVNGKAWVAQSDCTLFCAPSFKVLYDGVNGGNLSLVALNEKSADNINQAIIIGFDSTNSKREFLYKPDAVDIGFSFVNNNLYTRSWDLMVIAIGKIILTKYDLTTGIVSGTFEFSLTKPGYEIINVTNGRFDAKL